MQIETLGDVVNWTRQLHQWLSTCLEHCSDNSEKTRVTLLLNYLADHERELVKILDRVEEDSDIKALNTWCYEYFQKNPVATHQHCDKPFADMAPEDIIREVIDLHNQVIDVYRQLNDQFDAPSATQLIQELLQLEQHEAMRIVQGSNRLADI